MCSVHCYSFDGRVVAKLPFVPISWLQNISHRNLLGEDYTDCSFIFLYILCTMSIRQVSGGIYNYAHGLVGIFVAYFSRKVNIVPGA